MEVGPWRWDGKSEHDFWVQPGGWEEYTTMVFSASFIRPVSRDIVDMRLCTVDQPAGTGFSYASTDRYVHTIDIVRNSRPFRL